MFTYAKGLTVWHEAIHSYGDDLGERKNHTGSDIPTHHFTTVYTP
jgi:hypothetical protein